MDLNIYEILNNKLNKLSHFKAPLIYVPLVHRLKAYDYNNQTQFINNLLTFYA